MLALKLDDSWRQVDLGGGLLQNRGPTTIEVAEETTLPQVAYSLLAYNEILSADKWGGDTVYLRKSRTASGDSAIVVVPNNATNELAAIQQIFEETDKGALFDFATIDDLYQDPTAITAAAVGSPVGAMMDVSRGLAIDPTNLALGNIVYSDAEWGRVGNTFTTTIPDDGSSAGAFRLTDVTAGKSYRIVGQVTRTNATQTGLFRVYVRDEGTATNILLHSVNGNGSFEIIALVTVNGSTNNLALSFNAQTPWRGSVTLTVQEIKGSHAFQSTTANQPRLQQTPTTGRYWLESIDAVRSLNITTPTVYGTMYVGRVTPEGMEWTTENWSTTTVNVLGVAGSYSAGFVARGREFMAAEKALIEAYFARQLPNLDSNTITNPEFSADVSGWTLQPLAANTLTWDPSGKAVAIVASVGGIYQNPPTETGEYYLFAADIGPLTGTAALRIGTPSVPGGGIVTTTALNGANRHRCVLAAPASTTNFYIRNSQAGTTYVDNCVARKLL